MWEAQRQNAAGRNSIALRSHHLSLGDCRSLQLGGTYVCVMQLQLVCISGHPRRTKNLLTIQSIKAKVRLILADTHLHSLIPASQSHIAAAQSWFSKWVAATEVFALYTGGLIFFWILQFTVALCAFAAVAAIAEAGFSSHGGGNDYYVSKLKICCSVTITAAL